MTLSASPELAPKSEPFKDYFDVPVAGGALRVARAGAPPQECRAFVLALHGMTGTHMVYRTVARELPGDICLLAPDLRGRGRSANLPGPYGMAQHVADLIAVLDHADAERAVVVGHSMGCSVAARLGADHRERTTAVVLLDGGVPILPEDMMADEEETEGEVHGILDRFDARYATGTWTAVERVQAPVRLMRAERGIFDDAPLIPLVELDEYLGAYPHISVDIVDDVNHFTLIIGEGHGPRRVAATLADLSIA